MAIKHCIFLFVKPKVEKFKLTNIRLIRIICILGIIFLLLSGYLIRLSINEVQFGLEGFRTLLMIFFCVILGLSFTKSKILDNKELIFSSIAVFTTMLMLWFFHKNGFNQNRFFSATLLIVLFTFFYQRWWQAFFHLIVFVSILVLLLFQSEIGINDRLMIMSSIIPSSLIALTIAGIKVKNELALKRSQNITSAIFEQSNDAFILTNNNTNEFVDCNKSALKLFDFETKSSIAKNLNKIVEHSAIRGLKINNAANIECELETENGTKLWTNVSVKEILTDFEKLKLYRFTDVSNFKKIELALIDNDKHISNIINRSSIIIFAIDIFGKFSLTNKHLSNVNSGYQKIGELSKKIYNEKEDIQQNLLKALSGEVFSEICEINNINYKINYSPIHNQSNNIIGGIGVAVDVSELMRAEVSLKQYAVQLESSNKELEQFAYIASHDLREPLRMITNYLQLLQSRYSKKIDKDADEFIEFAVSGAQRMNVLINDLLQYSRVGTKERSFEKVDGYLILKEALNNLSVAIEESSAKIELSEMPILIVDRTQFVQLFQNLIANAIKYRSLDRKPIIKISVTDKIIEWEFTVEDNGIGIEEEYLERIFGIFQRLHTINKYEGTGIGLAVCKKIVEKHHGEIWVKSQLNKGSIFYFTIPK